MVEEGARGIVWAATLPEDGHGGGFFRHGEPIDWWVGLVAELKHTASMIPERQTRISHGTTKITE
jgi:hypothetical protein